MYLVLVEEVVKKKEIMDKPHIDIFQEIETRRTELSVAIEETVAPINKLLGKKIAKKILMMNFGKSTLENCQKKDGIGGLNQKEGIVQQADEFKDDKTQKVIFKRIIRSRKDDHSTNVDITSTEEQYKHKADNQIFSGDLETKFELSKSENGTTINMIVPLELFLGETELDSEWTIPKLREQYPSLDRVLKEKREIDQNGILSWCKIEIEIEDGEAVLKKLETKHIKKKPFAKIRRAFLKDKFSSSHKLFLNVYTDHINNETHEEGLKGVLLNQKAPEGWSIFTGDLEE